jgi:peptidoglycan/LPS O-acetylase OafA/YrhL
MLLFVRLGISPPNFMRACTTAKLAANVAMLPLGYAAQAGLDGCQLMPQAWSLGLEFSFYLVVPWLLLAIRSRSALRAVMVGSTIVFILAVFGVLETDQWGYRLLPGTLFMFMTGMALTDDERLGKAAPYLVFALACVLFAATRVWRPLYALHYNKEVLSDSLAAFPSSRSQTAAILGRRRMARESQLRRVSQPPPGLLADRAIHRQGVTAFATALNRWPPPPDLFLPEALGADAVDYRAWRCALV